VASAERHCEQLTTGCKEALPAAAKLLDRLTLSYLVVLSTLIAQPDVEERTIKVLKNIAPFRRAESQEDVAAVEQLMVSSFEKLCHCMKTRESCPLAVFELFQTLVDGGWQTDEAMLTRPAVEVLSRALSLVFMVAQLSPPPEILESVAVNLAQRIVQLMTEPSTPQALAVLGLKVLARILEASPPPRAVVNVLYQGNALGLGLIALKTLKSTDDGAIVRAFLSRLLWLIIFYPGSCIVLVVWRNGNQSCIKWLGGRACWNIG